MQCSLEKRDPKPSNEFGWACLWTPPQGFCISNVNCEWVTISFLKYSRVTKKLKRFVVQEVFACLALSGPKTETVMCLLCYLYLSSKPEAQCLLSEEARKYCPKLLPCERVLKWCPFRRLSFSLHPAGCENPLLPFHVTFGYLCPALKSSTLESPALDISFC